MKRATIVLTAFAYSLGAAWAANDADAPTRYHQHGMTIILHSSTKAIALAQGDNEVGNPRTFTCSSVGGCVVSLSISLHHLGSGDGSACLQVDGIAVTAACGTELTNSFDNLFGEAKVMTGTHSISLTVRVLQPDGDTISELAEEYRIYDRTAKVTD
jgi:hypothetical protein